MPAYVIVSFGGTRKRYCHAVRVWDMAYPAKGMTYDLRAPPLLAHNVSVPHPNLVLVLASIGPVYTVQRPSPNCFKTQVYVELLVTSRINDWYRTQVPPSLSCYHEMNFETRCGVR